MSSFQEKRAHSRVSKSIKIGLQEDSIILETETKNISVSGINCTVSKEIPLLTRLGIRMELPCDDKPRVIKFGGVVVRSLHNATEKNYDVAIFIDEISEGDRVVLQRFVTSD